MMATQIQRTNLPLKHPAPAEAGGAGYRATRARLETYFDRTAREDWERLTSDAPVSGIRATVRAGRDRMRETLLSWLPADLRRTRLLDAGCGTGALAVAAAWRGAEVVAVDVAAGLVDVARARAPAFLGHGSIAFRSGDMLNPALGSFDHVVAMDSLIHYSCEESAQALAALARRTTGSILVTFAPRTPALSLMFAAGKLFPRADRAPAIVPVAERRLRARLDRIEGWRTARTARISSGFYTSQALELVRA
jgi:magnesium-protoporphyrin O-methyltransferase